MQNSRYSSQTRRFMGYLFLLLCLFSTTVSALEMPKNRVVLTVTGQITNTNSNQAAKFDLDMLSSLPTATILTDAPWTKTVHKYEGFYLQDLLKVVNAHASTVRVTALNEYISEIPIEDFTEKGAIIATHMDGKRISVRKLGPLLVIYDFDSHRELRKETYFGRSVWQVKSIEFIE
ncbi:molybdopterin-dependent oxidoreductase [Marinomonas balearica]|uniref:Oxidoreductase molybdopterin-binding domain-containing protein n=1 Tax=Marinomonas balearica TaxID=491947 RepID=A0A4R6M8I4_9GAMM|nr:molybdopterin-dependent oxidoreductase [Marinomonas balearica]TDO97496.1 hypothetical protein DFP79_2317 [Marinomonas balearica]